MSIYQLLLIPLFAFCFSVLDTSFFAFYETMGSTVISSFLILMLLCIFDKKQISIYYGAFCILFLSAFSSLPLYSMIIGYLGIPLLFVYVRQKFYFESSILPAVVVMLISCFLFRLLLLPISDFSSENMFLSIIIFPLINTLFGMVLFTISKKLLFNKKY